MKIKRIYLNSLRMIISQLKESGEHKMPKYEEDWDEDTEEGEEEQDW